MKFTIEVTEQELLILCIGVKMLTDEMSFDRVIAEYPEIDPIEFIDCVSVVSEKLIDTKDGPGAWKKITKQILEEDNGIN